MGIKSNNLVLVTPFVMLFFGVLAMGVTAFNRTVESVQTWFVRVEHPAKPSFESYDKLLKEVVVKVGERRLVDYDAVKKSPNLGKALAQLAGQSSDKFEDEDDKLAYWINAYNLLALKCTADHYPAKTAKVVSLDLHRHRFVVGGKSLSAEEILRNHIYPDLVDTFSSSYDKDAIPFLLCRGTRGEPDLLDHAITGASLNADSLANRLAFITNKENVFVSPDGRKFMLSTWFQWHNRIFSTRHRNLHKYIYSLLPEGKPAIDQVFSLDEYDTRYNWAMNSSK
jgi:hypothetical protein